MGGGRAPTLAALLVGSSLASLLAVACNALNGSGDLNVGDGSGISALPDGGRASDGGGGGGGEGGLPGADGGGTTGEGGSSFIPDAGVDPKVEPCGMNLVCLPDVGGWSPAVFLVSGGGQMGCPAEYPQASVLRQSGGGGCNCDCAPSGGSCAGSVASKSGPACAGQPTSFAVTSGACTTLTADFPVPVAFVPHPNSPPPTSCGASVAPQLGKPRTATFCTGAMAAATGSMCDPGEICVNKPTFFTGGLSCIVHDGDIACPSHLPFRTLVGTAIADGRSCGSVCACQQEPCAGTIEAFSDPACMTSVRSVSVDGTCTTTGAAVSGASYRFTPSSGCGVSSPAKVLGTETYSGAQTLCCSFGF
jgi:hypothetical protein